MATNEINLKIVIDGKEAQASVKLTDNELHKLAESIRQAGNESRNAGETIVHSFAQARNLIQGLKETFSMFSRTFQTHLNAYQAQEGALIKLNTALKQSGKLTDENVKSLVDYSKQLQQTTIYGDEVTQTVMAQLIAMGLTVDQTRQATLQAANLATIMGTDLNGAARAMADLFNGNVGMIGRYIKGLDETIIKSGDLDKIMAMLNERIGGQAEAMGNTAAGSIAKMNNAIGDLKENTGALLSKALAPLIKMFSDIVSKINDLSPALSGIIGLTGSLTTAFVTLRVTGILPAIKSVELFGVALTGLRATLIKTGIGALIVALGYGLYELAKAYEHFIDVAGKADKSYSNVLDTLRSEAVNAKKEELNWLIDNAEKSRDKLKADLEKLKADMQAATKQRRIMDKEGNEYFIPLETEKSKILSSQIKQTEQLLKLEENKLKIYDEIKNKVIQTKGLTDDEKKKLFEKLKTELAEQQRHKEALLRLETTNDLAILNQKLQHFEEMINLYKKYGQDITALLNRQKETELELRIKSKPPEIELPDTLPFEPEELADVQYGNILDYARLTKEEELKIWYDAELKKIEIYENFDEMRGALDAEFLRRKKDLADQEGKYKLDAASRTFAELGGIFKKHTAAYKIMAVGQTIIETYKAATAALAPPPIGAGPLFGPILAASTIIAGLANVAKIQETDMGGFASGGRLPRGKAGFVEGWHNEIIAPEKTFVEIFRQELRPQIYNNSNYNYNLKELSGSLEKLNDAVSKGIVARAYLDDREAIKIYLKAIQNLSKNSV